MAKTKEQINREDLTYSMLRKVIIRADFTPMLDLDAMVSDINSKEWFQGKFNNFERRLLQVKNDDPKGRNLDEAKVMEGQVVKRFDDCNIVPERNVSLDISSEFVVLEIRCDEKYTTIDDYLELMTNIVHHIFSKDAYVKLERIAIRKTDGMEFEDGGKADEVFEYFDQKVVEDGDQFRLRSYTDSFLYGKRSVLVHYNKTVRVTNGNPTLLIFLLDVDAFLDRSFIENRRPDREEIWSIFYERLNKTCFDLFKLGVKEKFLNDNLKKKND